VEILKAVSSQGFRGIEISAEPGNPMAFQPEILAFFSVSQELDIPDHCLPMWNYSLVDAARLIKRNNLNCESINASCELCHPISVEMLIQRVEMARLLNVSRIITGVGCGWEPETARQMAVNNLRMVCHYALQFNVEVCLKTDGWLADSPRIMLEVLERVNQPNLKVDYDPANIVYNNDRVDVTDYLKAVIEKIGIVHLRGGNGKKGAGFPALGNEFDVYREMFSVLAESGFCGPLCLDLENAYLWEPRTSQTPLTIFYSQERNGSFDQNDLEKHVLKVHSSLEYLSTITQYVF
jgi:sugar phosphate isomerase/epimerase